MDVSMRFNLSDNINMCTCGIDPLGVNYVRWIAGVPKKSLREHVGR